MKKIIKLLLIIYITWFTITFIYIIVSSIYVNKEIKYYENIFAENNSLLYFFNDNNYYFDYIEDFLIDNSSCVMKINQEKDSQNYVVFNNKWIVHLFDNCDTLQKDVGLINALDTLKVNEIKAFSYTQKKYSSTALTIEGYEIFLFRGEDLNIKYEYILNDNPYYQSKYIDKNERKEKINNHWSGYYISRKREKYKLEWWEYK